jgi:hypothetical protein
VTGQRLADEREGNTQRHPHHPRRLRGLGFANACMPASSAPANPCPGVHRHQRPVSCCAQS